MNVSRNAYSCATELRIGAWWGCRIREGKSKPAHLEKPKYAALGTSPPRALSHLGSFLTNARNLSSSQTFPRTCFRSSFLVSLFPVLRHAIQKRVPPAIRQRLGTGEKICGVRSKCNKLLSILLEPAVNGLTCVNASSLAELGIASYLLFSCT